MEDKGKEVKGGDQYDPYVERKLPKATNNTESMIHIVKGILGTGILAMPEAFKNSGIILGLVGSIGNGLLCTYEMHILVKCMYMLCKRNKLPVLTYTHAMTMGFEQGPPWAQRKSKAIRILTDSFIIFYQVGVCCVYTLFVVVNLKSVGDVYLKNDLSIHSYLLMVIVPLLLINSLRNLKLLVPFSFLANAITFLTIGVVFYYIFESPLPPLSERPLFQPLRFPLAFGTTCFAFTAVPVVMAVENNMKTPKHFGGYFGIYNRSLAVLMTLYIALAFLGFWQFGEETKSSIALNFPPKSTLSQVVNLLYAFAIFTSYGLNGFVPIQLVWDTYLLKRIETSTYKVAWEYFLRVSLVSISVFFAATIPMLGLFMSVFGAITLSHLIFIFPSILDICVRYPDNYGHMNFYKWRDIFFICYGIIGLITGVSVGIREIILEYIKMYSK